jgi:hypothetical protein
MYQILPYTIRKAKEYGVEIRPSSIKSKKIDVFKNGVKIASVGGYGYKDYPTYLKEDGKTVADSRRALYKIRHRKDLGIVGSNGWWADKLLW